MNWRRWVKPGCKKLLDAHLAPALEKAVGHFAGSVVKDLEADLKAWQRVTKPSGGKRQRS